MNSIHVFVDVLVVCIKMESFFLNDHNLKNVISPVDFLSINLKKLNFQPLFCHVSTMKYSTITDSALKQLP